MLVPRKLLLIHQCSSLTDIYLDNPISDVRQHSAYTSVTPISLVLRHISDRIKEVQRSALDFLMQVRILRLPLPIHPLTCTLP
jgi:hypothetical protein